MTWLPNHLSTIYQCVYLLGPLKPFFLPVPMGYPCRLPFFAEIQCVTESTRNTMLPRIDVFSRSGRPSWPHFTANSLRTACRHATKILNLPLLFPLLLPTGVNVTDFIFWTHLPS
ncbi:hypothetical protein ASPFODRAFT_577081 [Aspergillus luchuensis CBS 106.47]|uniref:Uncharacterized protein n=1 Tax=Aspergillus luchuensis (strain CBS 106.47) TaxID=1137211 RepID=A0A1M3TLL3_ASPLC|nr:hypothetical protein ASPFODRAFT_577081 [Aspergillus luchuensis CBS 106.47]